MLHNLGEVMMELSKAERLQLLMLCDIYRKLEVNENFDPDVIQEAILSGNTWALDWTCSFLDAESPTKEQVSFVVDVIDMFGLISYTYKKITEDQKDELIQIDKHFGREDAFVFPGFDGNNESEYLSIAHMLKKMDRFNTQVIDINSHHPTIATYKRMLEVFLPARDRFIDDIGISFEDLKDIVLARIHPSKR